MVGRLVSFRGSFLAVRAVSFRECIYWVLPCGVVVANQFLSYKTSFPRSLKNQFDGSFQRYMKSSFNHFRFTNRDFPQKSLSNAVKFMSWWFHPVCRRTSKWAECWPLFLSMCCIQNPWNKNWVPFNCSAFNLIKSNEVSHVWCYCETAFVWRGSIRFCMTVPI